MIRAMSLLVGKSSARSVIETTRMPLRLSMDWKGTACSLSARSWTATDTGGAPASSIFSTPEEPVGTQMGTPITSLVRKADHAPAKGVGFRHLWGRQIGPS